MEIKHTVEILTKDIQDIEKLVRNLDKYEHPPMIEIDLALSKLRNLYEVLSLIGQDAGKQASKNKIETGKVVEASDRRESSQVNNMNKTISERPPTEPEINQNIAADEVPPTEPEEIKAEGRITEASSGVVMPAEEPEEVDINPQAPPEKQAEEMLLEIDIEADKEELAPAEKELDKENQAKQEEPANNENPISVQETSAESVKQNSEQTLFPEEDSKTKGNSAKNEPDSSILADKFKPNQSLYEKISTGSTKEYDSKFKGDPIDSIKRNIGINDRFMIIRDLLQGNSEAFNILIQELDDCDNFQDAFGQIEAKFPDKMDHPGVDVLVRLSRRRYPEG